MNRGSLNNLINSRQNPIGSKSEERDLNKGDQEHKHQLSQGKARPGRTKKAKDEKLSNKFLIDFNYKREVFRK